jgi:outer membrane protein assembly factor BamB
VCVRCEISSTAAAVCAPRWKAQLTDAVIDSSVSVASGVAYVGDFSGHLYAFTAAGCGAAMCEPLWVGLGLTTELIGAPAVGNGYVYVTTFNSTPDLVSGRLLVFPAAGCGKASCAPSWTADIGGPAGSTAAPAVTTDTVYTTSGTLFGNGVNTNFHLMAFRAAGCHAKTCKPLRTYDTGDGGAEGAPAVSGGTVFATTQASPDPNTLGVVAAYPAAGCGNPQCEPLWTGINFVSGFASPPSVADGVVFVGKGPASDIPDAGLYAFNAAGCGAATCAPISFLQLSNNQFYLGAPLAIAEGKVFMASNDNNTGRSNVYAIGLRR